MPIRVLIVDDSALMRQMLTEVLNADPDIEVCDTASDPIIAREKIKRLNPDVLTLDVEMPRMNGIEFLCRLMALRPMPVIMVSSLTREGSDTTLRALALGAVDFVAKPAGFIGDGLADLAQSIRDKVKAAAKVRVSPGRSAERKRETSTAPAADQVIVIGASTGGVPAVTTILESLPADMPPIIIAQHMPAGFTQRFAERVNELTDLNVIEAADGMTLRPGCVYVAPGGLQTRLERGRKLSIRDEGRINGFCPCVDVLFDSVGAIEKERTVGVILTGMGQDGAAGMVAIRAAHGHTLGQDEGSSLIYGMPRVAWERGGVARQVPITQMAQALLRLTRTGKRDLLDETQSQFTHP